MDNNNITDKAFWLAYWESKENLVFEIPPHYPFLNELESLITTHNVQTLLEVGGFPGYYSVWAQKKGIAATLLDFIIHPQLLHNLEKSNGVNRGSVKSIEADLFSTKGTPSYDLVISNGFIEHFLDTEDVLRRHVDYLKPGGVLFISLPNFRGLNGWFQKRFDRENYAKHNIECMDIQRLRLICQHLKLKDINVRYSGYFMLWLENPEKKSVWVRIFRKLLWLPVKVFFKFFPFNSKSFSPYIVITAVKPG